MRTHPFAHVAHPRRDVERDEARGQVPLDAFDHRGKERHHEVLRQAAAALRRLVVLVPVGLHQPHDGRCTSEDVRGLVGVRLIGVEDERLVLAHKVGAVHAQARRADVAEQAGWESKRVWPVECCHSRILRGILRIIPHQSLMPLVWRASMAMTYE